MRGPTTSELLLAWERGLGSLPAERALTLLSSAPGPTDDAELAALSVGERDAQLLDLREWAFGAELTGTATCPDCSAELEFPIPIEALRSGPPEEPDREGVIQADGERVSFRLPDGSDLVVAAETGTLAGARRTLLDRCVLGAERAGSAIAASALSDSVIERLEAELTARDPQADVQLAITCPDCGHGWSALFDIAAFLWTEVDQWARRILVDIATLATAFGWTEAEVLGLGPARREAYLELAGR